MFLENIFRLILFVCGIVNFIPGLLVFFPSKLYSSYGISKSEANLELLLRHRAVMLGLIGICMIFSSITLEYILLSTTIGLVSMISFIILYFPNKDNINKQLTKVMKIDLIASLFLFIAFLFYILT